MKGSPAWKVTASFERSWFSVGSDRESVKKSQIRLQFCDYVALSSDLQIVDGLPRTPVRT